MTQRAPTGLVGEMVLATSRLVSALEAEVEALRRGEVKTLDGMRAEKARRIRAYEAKLQALKSQPTLRSLIEPTLSAELEQATRSLQAVIDRNVAQLRAAAEANRRLVDALARAAVDQSRRPSYGPRGTGAAHGRFAGPVAAARTAAGPATISRQL